MCDVDIYVNQMNTHSHDFTSATMLCTSQGLRGSLLDGCIYDVVITNDTTLTQQEVLKTGKVIIQSMSTYSVS